MLTTAGCATVPGPVPADLAGYEVAAPETPSPVFERAPVAAGVCDFAGAPAVAFAPEEFVQLEALVEADAANRKIIEHLVQAYLARTAELVHILNAGRAAERMAQSYRDQAEAEARASRRKTITSAGILGALLGLGIVL